MPITHEYSSPQFLARSASAPPIPPDQNMLNVPRALLVSPSFSPAFTTTSNSNTSNYASNTLIVIEEITRVERRRKQNPALELDPRLKRALEVVYQNDLEHIFGECEAADILLAVCSLSKHVSREQLTVIYEKTLRLHVWNDAEFLDCHQIIAEQALKDLEFAANVEEGVKTRMSFLFQAVFKQTSLLLEKIAGRLCFPGHLEAVLWSLLAEAIISKSHRRFFRGRDLLTMICCFVFAVGKLIGIEISFNNLMEACRHERLSDFEVAFLNVASDGQNIVRFYNEHFLTCFKEFILQAYTSPPKHGLLHITRTSGAVLDPSPNVRIVTSYRRSLSMEPKTRKRLCWTF